MWLSLWMPVFTWRARAWPSATTHTTSAKPSASGSSSSSGTLAAPSGSCLAPPPSPPPSSCGRVRTATLWIGTARASSRTSVTTSALAVMPGRRSVEGSVMAILTSNSVFWSVVPEAATLALLAISVTTPLNLRPDRASTSMVASSPSDTATTSFSSTSTSASMPSRLEITMMTSDWNCEPSAISPSSLLSLLTVPDIGA